jgi:glyoxylase-like metal-dependent hydrolase (beta-lactamase superfamily II)
MKPQLIVDGVYRLGLGGVAAYVIETPQGAVLVDTGMPGSAKRILAGLAALGMVPSDVAAIVVTHCHVDHTGGLAELRQATRARVWMSTADAQLVRAGVAGRAFEPGPTRMSQLIATAANLRRAQRGRAVAVDYEVDDGDRLPFGGLRVIATPGHTRGHISLLLPRAGGVLFVGDAAANRRQPGMGPIFENFADGRRSLAKLAGFDFEVACFAHGKPIREHAAAEFRARWGASEVDSAR